MIAEDVERVKQLYSAIVNGEFGDDSEGARRKASIIRELEHLTGRQFRGTAEFHREVSAFIEQKDRVRERVGTRIRRARKKAGLTQKGLGELLGVTKRTVIRWETNEIPPSPKALEWLNGKNGLYGGKVT